MKTEAIFIVGTKRIRLTPDEAALRNKTRGDCTNCGKAVRLHRKGKNGQAAHFEHLRHDKKCGLADQSYD
jgi:hypothetical protein